MCTCGSKEESRNFEGKGGKLKERAESLQYIEDSHPYISLNCFFNSVKRNHHVRKYVNEKNVET